MIVGILLVLWGASYVLIQYEGIRLAELPDLPAEQSRYLAQRSVEEAQRVAIYLTFMAASLGGLLGVFFVRQVVRPVRKLRNALERVREGDLGQRVDVDTGDELGEVAGAFNEMVAELWASREALEEHNATLERRVVERTHQLDYQKRFTEDIVKHAETGIFTLDAHFRITGWNDYLERMSGISPKEAVGKLLLDIFPFQDRNVLREELDSVLSGTPVARKEHEQTLSQASGIERKVYIDYSLIPITGDSGHIQAILGTLYDETEKKELHKQISQSAKLAAVGELAGGVAHEINNPLAIILGYSELLLEEHAANGGLVKSIEKVRRHALRCKDIVAKLLKFARRTKAGMGPVDLKRLLPETLDLLRKQMELDNIVIEEDYSEGLGSFTASEDELQQLFFNIFSNAKDAMPRGGTLQVSTTKKDGQAHISVSDTGVGIPAEVIERIYSPFFTTKDPGKGTGLGLSICHTVVERHGGSIDVSSEVGKGTTFTIRLPVSQEKRVPEEEILGEKVSAGETVKDASSDGATTGAKRLLVVDDESGIREICREFLSKHGYDVTTVSDGRQAIQRVEEHGPFDLLLMDLKMPGMNGAETIRHLRDSGNQTPVLIMTGLIDEAMLSTVPEGGYQGIVKKPFQMSELLRQLQREFEA